MSRVSYVMMHDEGAGELTAADPRPACATSSASSSPERASHRTRPRARRRDRRQPDHASPRSRHRSDPARHRAVHARDRRAGRRVGRRHRPRPARTRTCTCCRASPGHVGADTAAAVLQEGPHRGDEIMLLVDVGTNAEIVLGNREWLFAASSPTGPAFEGAQLVCRASGRPRVPSSGCGSTARRSSRAVKVIGVRRLVGRRRLRDGVAGIESPAYCGSGVIEALAELFLAGVILRDGTIDGAGRERSPRSRARRAHVRLRAPRRRPARELRITQNDVRADPARQGRAERRASPADGPRRHHELRHRPPGGRVRHPHRPDVRDRDRPDPRLRSRRSPATSGNAAGQRRGARVAVDRRPAPRSTTVVRGIVKIETATEPALPGALRAGDGLPGLRRRRAAAAPAALPKPRGADAMNDEETHEPRRRPRPGARGRTGGRAGARPRALATHIEAVAVPHAHAEAVRGRERRGPRDHRAQRRHDPRRGRRHRSRLPRRARALRERRRRRRRRARPLPPRHVPVRSCRRPRPPIYTQHAAQPRPQRADRRRRHRVRAQLRVAVRARPRRRPPLRDARRLPELREAGVHVAEPASLGRHGVRTRRHSGEQASPRHGVRAPALQRQAVHGLGHRRCAAPPTAWSWRASGSAATSPTAR